jgi:hypothetical protein
MVRWLYPIAILCAGCGAALPDLGADFAAREAGAGRFASAVHVSSTGGCSQTFVQGTSRGSFTLTLDQGGAASACLGEHSRSDVYSGRGEPDEKPDDVQETRRQIGLRGRWSARGKWIELELKADGAVCPMTMAPPAPGVWAVRCLGLSPASPGSPLPAPALACHFKEEAPIDLAVGGVLPIALVDGELTEKWVFLGEGAGLQVSADRRWHVAQTMWFTTLRAASKPIVDGSWREPSEASPGLSVLPPGDP